MTMKRMIHLTQYLIITVILVAACSPSSYITKVDKVPIVYDDVQHLHDLLSKYSAKDINEAIIQKEYFDKGTPGLKGLIEKDRLSAATYAQYVSAHYGFLKSVCAQLPNIQSQSHQLKGLLKQFSDYFPNARYMPSYFVIGQGYHGGTATPAGFVIELQKNVLGLPNIDKSTIDTTKISSYDNIDQLWIHEQVHIARKKQHLSSSLLRMTIDEGSADFIAYKMTGKISHARTYQYGEENHERLVKEWKEDLKKDATKVRVKWVWNWGRSSTRPPDIAYYIGFKITEAYYDNHDDKERALKDILEMKSYENFYKMSGF